jgi:hypothetical protein
MQIFFASNPLFIAMDISLRAHWQRFPGQNRLRFAHAALILE